MIEAVTLAAFVADIERRHAETGLTDIPPDSGDRHSENKKALLKAIEDAGGKW